MATGAADTFSGQFRGRGSFASALAVTAIHVAIGYALIMATGVALPPPRHEARPQLTVLEPERPKEPTPPAEPPRQRPKKEAQAGSRAPRPPRIVDARPPVLPEPPPLILASPPVLADSGSSTDGDGAGAAGSGAGEGAGDGAGDGEGAGFTEARQTGGRFRNSDFPDSVRAAGRLRIGVRYAVGPKGRVDQCEIVRSSGYPEVDAMTCRVIVERYRFKPARDEDGFPITEVLEESYSWKTR